MEPGSERTKHSLAAVRMWVRMYVGSPRLFFGLQQRMTVRVSKEIWVQVTDQTQELDGFNL